MRSCCCTPKVTTYSGSTPHSSSVRTCTGQPLFFYLFLTLHILWINEFRFEILNENNNNKSKCVWLKLERITWQMRMSLFLFYMYMECSFKSMKICRIHVYHCCLKSFSDMLANILGIIYMLSIFRFLEQHIPHFEPVPLLLYAICVFLHGVGRICWCEKGSILFIN